MRNPASLLHHRFKPLSFQENASSQEVLEPLALATEELSLKVFPNPTKAECSIQVRDAFRVNRAMNGELVVSDFMGKVMHKVSLENVFEWTISVGQWPAGLYMVSLYDESRIHLSQQILVFP